MKLCINNSLVNRVTEPDLILFIIMLKVFHDLVKTFSNFVARNVGPCPSVIKTPVRLNQIPLITHFNFTLRPCDFSSSLASSSLIV